MPSLASCLTAALTALLATTLGAQDRVHERIDSLVRAEMVRQKIPGVAVAVVRNGAVFSAKG